MPVLVIGAVLALGVWGYFALSKPKRRSSRVIVAGGPAGIPMQFESESQARAYFEAHAARIAATGNVEAIDIAMQAMRELGIQASPGYDALGLAASSASPLMDPWA